MSKKEAAGSLTIKFWWALSNRKGERRGIERSRVIKTVDRIFKGTVDILEPLISAFRKRVQGVPLHFDHAIFLNLIFEIWYSSTQLIGLMGPEQHGQACRKVLYKSLKWFYFGKKPMGNPIEYFSSLTDPRVERTKEHLLEDIIFITIAAVICGCENWNDIESYGHSKQEWLSGFLRLPSGIPSHDTFNRVFAALVDIFLTYQHILDAFALW